MDEKKVYGNEVVKPEVMARFVMNDENIKSGKEVDLIPLRGLKGLIWGFYSPSPWMVWLRVAALPYGMEITRFGHLAWWKQYSMRILKAKG